MAQKDSVKITVTGIDNVVASLGRMDKNLIKDLRKDMGNAIRPTAAIIKSRVPTQGSTVLSGLDNHQGRTRWNPVKTTIKFYPKVRKQGYGYKPLVGIDITGHPGGLGFDYAELAGASKRKPRPRTKAFTRQLANGETRTYTRVNNHGDQFIRVLKEAFPMRANAGRFAYRVFRQELPQLEATALRIIETYAAKVNRRIGIK